MLLLIGTQVATTYTLLFYVSALMLKWYGHMKVLFFNVEGSVQFVVDIKVPKVDDTRKN